MSDTHWIRTDRLLLRPFQQEDLGRLILLSHDPGFTSQFGSFQQPLDQSMAHAWVDSSNASIQDEGRGHWAILEHGQIVGVASLLDHCLDGDKHSLTTIEYRLAQSARGRGLATEALAGLLEFGVSELGIQDFYAFISSENAAAKNVAFKLSMTFLKRAFFAGHPIEVFHVRPTHGHPQTRFGRSAESAA